MGPEIADFFAGMRAEPEAVLVAEGADGHLMAVAELSIRTNLPSLLGQPVGYVEGFFIVPEARGQGIARSLLQASREWARQQGCTGFASDRAGRSSSIAPTKIVSGRVSYWQKSASFLTSVT